MAFSRSPDPDRTVIHLESGRATFGMSGVFQTVKPAGRRSFD